jgi:phenylacetate-CoA ligase
MPTTLAIEQAEQRRWRLRSEWENVPWFDTLLRHEFLPADEQRAREARALSRLIRFATDQVPYYKHRFSRLKIAPSDVRQFADLPRLPSLTKLDLHQQARALRSLALPEGERLNGFTQSSGSTGRPARVLQTNCSQGMFGLLKQREYRWFRFDPAGSCASIRLSSQLPRAPKDEVRAEDTVCRLAAWDYVGRFFETGPFFGYAVTNSLERLLSFLAERRPDYLISYSETLEHLALGCQEGKNADSLRATLAISEQLTPSMRRRVERTFGVPVHQNYGLNEIGLVASRCPEVGRYHVHTEHCLVEVVDEQGQACAPGQVGRILVTSLTNRAMPLLRYDTDDLAEAVDGPCPCGRTLPSFGNLVGRYSRIAFLPPGTLGLVGTIRDALENMPQDLSVSLRQFQLHQYRGGDFELRLVAVKALPAEFMERLNRAWKAAVGPHSIHLRILEVGQIARSPGGKFQDFTSDFVPPPDTDKSFTES